MYRTIFFPVRRAVVFSALACAVMMVAAGCADREGTDRADSLAVGAPIPGVDTSSASGADAGSIYTVLSGEARFSTFATALDSAKLDQTLSGPGPFTVFAPTNQAFGQMGTDLNELLRKENEDRLRDLLLNHISNGERMGSALAGQIIRTLAGGDLEISGSGDSLQVDGAGVVEADIDAENGVIHGVDRVLIPSEEESL